MTKRIISAVLTLVIALSLLATCLVGCAQNKTNEAFASYVERKIDGMYGIVSSIKYPDYEYNEKSLSGRNAVLSDYIYFPQCIKFKIDTYEEIGEKVNGEYKCYYTYDMDSQYFELVEENVTTLDKKQTKVNFGNYKCEQYTKYRIKNSEHNANVSVKVKCNIDVDKFDYHYEDTREAPIILAGEFIKAVYREGAKNGVHVTTYYSGTEKIILATDLYEYNGDYYYRNNFHIDTYVMQSNSGGFDYKKGTYKYKVDYSSGREVELNLFDVNYIDKSIYYDVYKDYRVKDIFNEVMPGYDWFFDMTGEQQYKSLKSRGITYDEWLQIKPEQK